MLDAKTCEEAMIRRDPLFDGLFFVGVRTTGIYCRPVCKVRMPRRENVTRDWKGNKLCSYCEACTARKHGLC
jgi:methylphosphotriester-DNA--protein-cysteine methyltransferase